MGGLSINPELRCLTCFHIYLIEISPNFPKCLMLKTCKCGTKTIENDFFISEYKKNKKLSISCFKCNKSNIKDSFYCEDCKKLLCINCQKAEHQAQKGHKFISIDKYDFFCILHQTENFCAFCKTCKTDVCNKCIQDKLHENHKISFYNKRYNEKKMEEFYKKAVKAADAKIDYNKIVCYFMKYMAHAKIKIMR